MEAGSQVYHISAHREVDQVDGIHLDVLSQSLEVTHIHSIHIPLNKDLVTWLHMAAGRLRSLVCLSSYVPRQISITLGEEINYFGRKTGNLSHLGIVGVQSYHQDKNEIMFMEYLTQEWHEMDAMQW